MKFIDSVTIHVKAGDGGVGCVSFRREKFVPRGGPDGGDGGRGGDIVLRANRQLNTLLDYQYKTKYKAPRGEHGLGSNKTGKSGNDVILEVPTGTVIRDLATGENVSDLVDDRQELIIAKGGRGGRGNAAFATSTNQAPRDYELGDPGEEKKIELELKLLADVGLVGFPNAGKSTLISVISAAKPKIADYPFTTLVPNLGIVRVDMGKSVVVADIPGLIEGAHAGRGLGIQFLRHIERTKVLVFLIEATSENPKADFKVLLNELKLFNKDLLKKPRIVALTKIDIIDEKETKKLSKVSFSGSPSLPISSVSGVGIKKLVAEMWKAVSGKKSHAKHA
jgi:GTP-binding protein